MRYDIRFRGVLVTTDDPGALPAPEPVDGFVDAVVAELEVLQAEDIDVSTDLSTSHVQLAISVDSATIFDAQEQANSAIRSAFHAAGGETPGWSIALDVGYGQPPARTGRCLIHTGDVRATEERGAPDHLRLLVTA